MNNTSKNTVIQTEEATNAVIDGPPEDMNGIPIPAQLLDVPAKSEEEELPESLMKRAS